MRKIEKMAEQQRALPAVNSEGSERQRALPSAMRKIAERLFAVFAVLFLHCCSMIRQQRERFGSSMISVIAIMVIAIVLMGEIYQRDITDGIVIGHCPKPVQLPNFIDRKEERDSLASNLLQDAGHYCTVVGSHGCGKSKLVQETIWELREQRKTPGLLYLQVNQPRQLANDIAEVLGNKRDTWLERALKFPWGKSKLYAIPEDPVKGIHYICVKLLDLGQQFRKMFGRPVVIALDDVDSLIDFEEEHYKFKLVNTAQLDALQDCAKRLADERVVTFVFIDGAGMTTTRFRQRTGRATRMREILIADIIEQQAKDYLHAVLDGTKISINKTYWELTGGRLQLLHEVNQLVNSEVESYEGLYDEIRNEVMFRSLFPCGLSMLKTEFSAATKTVKTRHRIVVELFSNGGQLTISKISALMMNEESLTVGDVLDLMIERNVLRFVSGGTVVKFHSVAVETAFRALGY